MVLIPDPGFRLLDIVCVDSEGERLPADITFENQSIALAPGIGNPIACTFELEQAGGSGDADKSVTDRDDKTVPAPKPGKWRGVDEAGAIRCGGFNTRLPKATENGRIEVKKGGRRLIATGVAEGRKTRIGLDADPDKLGRWSGKVKVREQGRGITLDYHVEIVTTSASRARGPATSV